VPSIEEKVRRPAVEAAAMVVADACCWAERRAEARRRAPESRRRAMRKKVR